MSGSRQSYGGVTPMPLASGPDAGSAGLASRQLAAGLAEVGQSFGALWGRLDQARAVNEAAGVVAQRSMDLADVTAKAEQDPDPATVPARFRDSIQQWRAKALEGLAPDVAAHVGRTLDGMIPAAYRQVASLSARRVTEGQRASLSDTLGIHAQTLAAAPDEPAMLAQVGAIKAAIAGNVRAGVVDEGAARRLFSHAVRQAVTIRAAADPIAAQALLDRWRGEMDAGDVAALATGLRAPVERREDETAAERAIAVSADVATRARQVEALFIARGWSPAAARGLAANAVAESAAHPNPSAGDGGRSTGLFQWNGPRRAAFTSRYGVDPGRATLEQQVEFADWELRNTEATAGAALAAAATPEDAARIASTRFLRPAATAAEEPRRAAIAARLGDGRATALEAVRAEGRDLPLHRQLTREALVDRWYAQRDQGQATERAALQRELTDLEAAYGQGQTGAAIPEERIRALLPADAAQRAVDTLSLARSAGDAVQAVAFAPPEQVADMRARLAGDGSPYLAAERGQLLRHYDAAVAARTRALRADPAGYAAAAPEVQALAAANAPPEQVASASLAIQARMGVPAAARRVLSDAQVEAIATTLRTADPAKQDMGATLTALQAEWGGALWGRAFGELVQHGKIGWEWQALAGMTAPAQAEGRAALQKALVFRAEKGGPEAVRKLLPADAAKGLPGEIDSTMASFREAVALHPGGASLFDTTRRAVELLAEWHAWRGASPAAAAERAYADVIGARWDVAGDSGAHVFGAAPTMLVPKGRAGEIEAALSRVRSGLAATDLAVLRDPGNPTAKPAELQAATLEAARRGVWINNRDASGAVLKGRTPAGGIVDLTRPDGTPIEIRFDALPKPQSVEETARQLREITRSRAP